MGDMVARLKLESGEFDSKIKRATQGLLSMEQEFRAAGKSLSDLDKDQLNYVKSLGKMETVSKTVRGQLGELKSGFTEYSALYKRMTEEEKKGEFGKALASSLDVLKGRIDETKKSLEDIDKTLNGSKSGGISGPMQVFAGNMYTKAAELAAKLGKEIFDIANESAELSKQAQGIQDAFERLGRGDLLDGLRAATHGTVTDLELMKSAVKFADFNLPLDQLGTMLAFAQQKAKDTGQSVDYMVDSIVTGLGRKSLMVLDNLGLSAAEIKDRMKETGDMTTAVGEIIKERMSAAGDYIETAADRATAANVELENEMLKLGNVMREAFGYTGWDDFATGLKVELIPILTTVAEKLALVKGYLWDSSSDYAKIKNYGVSAIPDEVKSDLEIIKNTPKEEREAKLLELEQKYIERYRTKNEELLKAYGDYPNSVERANNSFSLGQYAALKLGNFFKKKKLKNIAGEAGAEENIIGILRKEAYKIINSDESTGGSHDNNNDNDDDKKIRNKTELQKVQEKIADLTAEAMTADQVRLEVIRQEIAALKEKEKILKNIQDYAAGKPLNIVVGSGPDVNKLYEEGTQKLNEELKEALGSTGVVEEFKNIDLASILKPLDTTTTKGKDEKNKDVDVYKEIGSITSGVGNIVSNLENLGISVPDGINKILGGISSVTSILTTISTIMTAIQSIQSATAATSFIPFFANSGIVPRAADGYYVPGSRMSGDTTPVLANAGEVILNRAAQGNLVSALSDSQSNADVGQPYVSGEHLFLVINNHLRRLGRGEIATTK